MLGSFAGDLTRAPDGYNAFFLVESFPETLGHAVILHLFEDLHEDMDTTFYILFL